MTPIRHIPKPPAGRPVALPWLLAIAILAVAASRHGSAPVAARFPVRPPVAGPNPLRLPLRTAAESHSIDTATLAGSSVLLADGVRALRAERGEPVTIAGWAVDTRAHRPSSAVYATIGDRVILARAGKERDDVARVLGNPAYARAGFELQIDTNSLPAGSSTVAFYGVDATGSARYDFHRTLTITLDDSSTDR